MPKLILSGCSPVPLAHYLKALGVLRLVSESFEGDSGATASWKADQLQLDSRFDKAALITFFLRDYQPTPVLAPWNGGSGFYKKDNREAINAISQSKGSRFIPYQKGIALAAKAVASLGLKEKPSPEIKAQLLHHCRNTLSDDALAWLDAVFVLGQDGPKYPPLLGTGGNDGRLEFTNNFMQRITELIGPATGEPTPNSERWLRAALFCDAAPGTTAKASIGQFFPGAAGGANATSGFDGPSAVNPWDFVLMIEGALLFAAASVKKLESTSDGSLVYPFCVRQAGVGYASASTSDEKDARCEMWMPLWEKPTTLGELRAVFGEGRAQVAGRAARNGVDFARAAVSLGVDHGITAFQRYGFQVRNGLAYFATPLGRVMVRRNGSVNLLTDIDHWHDRLRSKSSDGPASISRALNTIERSMLDLCREGSPDSIQSMLIALGQGERSLAKSFKWTTEAFLRPLSGLRPEWLYKLDGTEFRLAASLAGTRVSFGKGRETLWLRQHLEPLEINSSVSQTWVSWDKTPGNDLVWHDGDLTAALNAILTRRIQRAGKAGIEGWADWSPRYAKLEDISAFIERRTDDALLADLIWGLSMIDWQAVHQSEQISRQQKQEDDAIKYDWRKDNAHRVVPSAFYALLKLCFRCKPKDGMAIPIVPAIHQRASSGDGLAASQLAARRLRASGQVPLVQKLPVAADTARRTAAALLFPISQRDLSLLEKTIQHQTEIQTA